MTETKPIPAGIRSLTLLLILITPAFTNLVEHAGSSILLLLTLTGIYVFYRTGPAAFSKHEKAVLWVFAAYFLVILVITLWHNLFRATLKIDVDHEIRMLSVFPIYYLFVRINPGKKIIWSAIIIGAVATGLYALVSAVAIDFEGRIVGPYNPCMFGYFSVALAFMSLSGYHFFYRLNKKLVLLPLLGFACGLLAAFFSGTRGSVITIPFLAVIFIFQIRRHLKSLNARVVMGTVAAVFLCLVFLFPHLHLAERFEKGIDEARYFIKNHDCVTCIAPHEAHHLRMWTEAAIIIKDHPVLGVGFSGYRRIVTDRVNTGQIAPGIEIFDEPHNMYLALWTAYGIPGLLVLLAFFLTPLAVFIHVIRTAGVKDGSRDMAYCGIYLVAGYMLFSLTGMLFIRNLLITFYLVMLAVILSALRPGASPAPEEKTF